MKVSCQTLRSSGSTRTWWLVSHEGTKEHSFCDLRLEPDPENAGRVMAAFREFGMPLIKRIPDERGFYLAPPKGTKVRIQMLLKPSGLLNLAADLSGVWQ